MGEIEVMGDNVSGRSEELAGTHVDPEQLLFEELSRIRDDPSLVTQLARLVQLSRDLRSRSYTGQVTLHLGNGLVNSARQEEWANWRRKEAP